MPKLVTRFTGQEIDVSEHEEGVLRGLGVVVDTQASTPEGHRAAAERESAVLAATAVVDPAAAAPSTGPAPRKRASRAKTKPTPPSPASVETPAGQQPAGDDDSQEG